MFDFSAEAGLWGLFVAAFMSATVLPGSSEIALVTVLHQHPEIVWAAIATATVANTLGGMTSYGVGRLVPNKAEGRAIGWLKRYGTPMLLMSWVPLIGDAICIAAGWLRLPVVSTTLLLAIGKGARYVVIGWAWVWLFPS
ncbi:MAG: DedA family protein [Betaproteobacteria bacterium]|nr:DedA family protein [Betaproteobacteria bacterium]